jgi:hypothetical protein
MAAGLDGLLFVVVPALVLGIPLSILSYPAFLSMKDAKAQDELSSRMQEIGKAMHAYHDAHDHLPSAAMLNKDGKPLLSWRVAILPYLGHGDLFRQFKLDQPWDSPHNLALAVHMPDVFALPDYLDEGAGSDRTYFQVYVGSGSLFEYGVAIHFGPDDIPDGTSSTILFVLAQTPVMWTKPEDLPFDRKGPVARPRCGAYPGYAVVFGDGRVECLDTSITDEELRGIITRNGGEPSMKRN